MTVMKNTELDARKMALVRSIIMDANTEEEVAELEAEILQLFHKNRPLRYSVQEMIDSLEEVEAEYIRNGGISHEEIIRRFTQ
jgi:hypothetical protein